MSQDRILEDVAEFKRQLQAGDLKVPSSGEDDSWSRSTRERLEALTKRRQALLKR